MIYFGSPVLIRPASWLPLLVSTLLSISLAHVHISRCGSPYLRRAAGGEGEVEFFVCILLRVFACKLFGDDEGGRLFWLVWDAVPEQSKGGFAARTSGFDHN